MESTATSTHSLSQPTATTQCTTLSLHQRAQQINRPHLTTLHDALGAAGQGSMRWWR
uniref:Uncharacterized protein n=1 Tax=Arundo donax TaxID=35708 RepID=A0A0A9F4Y6_ARUDO